MGLDKNKQILAYFQRYNHYRTVPGTSYSRVRKVAVSSRDRESGTDVNKTKQNETEASLDSKLFFIAPIEDCLLHMSWITKWHF